MEVTSRSTYAFQVREGDQSQAGFVRRQALALAAQLDFSESAQSNLGIVATEAGRNLAVHGGGGEVILCPWEQGKTRGIDILALDRGVGMADVSLCLSDGYSTAGTPGGGLGAMSRLADIFEIHSAPGQGTAIFTRLLNQSQSPGARTRVPVHDTYPVGCVTVPIAGETVSGDAWYALRGPERSLYLMADGLGHGFIAAQAAGEAVEAFVRSSAHPPERILNDIHGALGKTRGAAVSVVEVDLSRKLISHAGIGNISAGFYAAGRLQSMVSLAGTVGHNIRTIRQFTYPWQPDSLLIMHSDGLGTHWTVEQYPGLALRHPALIAGVIYRDQSRKRDDTTILVSRI